MVFMSPAPIQSDAVVELAQLQLQAMSEQYQRSYSLAVQEQRGLFLEAISEVQALVDAIESGSDVTDAVARAKARIQEWTQ